MRGGVDRLSPLLRWTLVAFAGLALTAGGLLTFGASETDDWFSWTIEPPLTAAALGAFYWGAFVLLAAAASARGWDGARPIVLPVFAIAISLLVITLIHLDKFDMESLFGVFWLCAYIAAPPLLVAGIALERRRPQPRPKPSSGRLPPPLGLALRAALAGEGAALLAVSALMLLAPDTAADFWPWALTPLTSRALGAFALGVALVALLVAREHHLELFRPTAIALIVLAALQLLAVAIHGEDLGGDDVATVAYVAFLAVLLATGAYALASASRAFSSS
jgi:peptidoglycan/LPS O-acetylase OafA/YrhL